MGKGISYAGDIVDAGAASTARETVQYLCSNPDFLETAAAKKPNVVWRFLQGVYSHPRDWWVGIVWCLMSLGVFGAEAQRNAQTWGRDLETILTFAKNNPELASRLLIIYLKHKALSSPEFYGRIAGGFFTNYAATGGRFGQRALPTSAKIGASAVNFVLATTGAMILAVKYGGKDIISAFDAFITGDYAPDLTSEQYKEIFREAVESEIPIPQEEQDAMVEIVDSVLRCLRNPGDYVGRSEKGQTRPHVPIGSVSSARPSGAMGTIPQGYETNALDVISDEKMLGK